MALSESQSGSDAVTYAELHAAANQCAPLMGSLGLTPLVVLRGPGSQLMQSIYSDATLVRIWTNSLVVCDVQT